MVNLIIEWKLVEWPIISNSRDERKYLMKELIIVVTIGAILGTHIYEGKLQLTPLKLSAIFNLTPKVLIFSIDPPKVSIFFNSGTPSVKATMTNETVITWLTRDHCWLFCTQNAPTLTLTKANGVICSAPSNMHAQLKGQQWLRSAPSKPMLGDHRDNYPWNHAWICKLEFCALCVKENSPKQTQLIEEFTIRQFAKKKNLGKFICKAEQLTPQSPHRPQTPQSCATQWERERYLQVLSNLPFKALSVWAISTSSLPFANRQPLWAPNSPNPHALSSSSPSP